ncbi:nitrogenase molybdenum-iron protein beta chain [Sporobacter termitidis DSM 10068]|uniref:Nitrogenase molybdenum-iron protein beta chain n=1 Tax=Sporobacter termitidis DSM 10068 TaxID=1123282 RepID=A0A1M5XF13_9FIRM|nr:nitrogenase component 1 [Sporobacter termitidis]SHH98376.1 nitrogenase molybdenum-iron protein beta chain [Sporobacter termitidis DSM 10068]
MTDFIERAKFACALGGAISTLEGLHHVVPIIHAAGGCANYLSNTYNVAAGYRGVGYCGGTMLSTSNIAENNVVFGGEGRLAEQIESTLFALDGDLYVVVTGCQVEIIGDDAVAVANRFKDRNVIGVSTPGFRGNALKGYDAVMNALVENVIEPAAAREEKTVNLFGVVPGQDVFFKGNLDQLKILLAKIGVKANTFFATGDTVADIRGYGSAALSAVLSPAAGLDPAERLCARAGIPYVNAELPIGPSGTESFLRQIGGALNVDPALIEAVIAAEKAEYYSFLERIVDIYADLDFQRYAIVAADSYYAHAITRFLANDLGWIPHLVAVNDIEEEDEQKLYAARFDDISSAAKPRVIFEQNAGLLLEHVRNSWPRNNNGKYYDALSPAYVVGSVIESSLAEKLGAGFLSVAFPVTNRVVLSKGYVGFRGALTFVEDLLTNLVSAR